MKKRTALFLSMAIGMTMTLAACSGGNEQPNDASAEAGEPAGETKGEGTSETGAVAFPLKERVTLKAVAHRPPLAPSDFNEQPLIKELEAKTNVHIDWETIVETDYLEKRNLLLASGTLPDFFFSGRFSDSELVRYSKDGILIPLDDLIENHMPNLKAILDARPDIKASLTAPDGHIYTLPQGEEFGSGQEEIGANPDFLYLNKAWLDKLGLAMPKTIDEYTEVLRAFKTRDPNGNGKADEIPFSGRERFSHTGHFFGAFDVPLNAWRLVDGKLTPNHVRPEMKDALAIYRQLYEEKLLDNEFITQPGNVWDNKIVTGQVGMWAHAATYPDTWLNRLRENVPEAEIALIPAPVGPSGKPGGVYAIGSSVSDFVWTIPTSVSDEKAIEIIKFFDWFYSDEAPSDFFLYGLEGEDHTKSGDTITYKYPAVKEDYDAEAMHQEWLHFTGPKLHLLDETFIKGRNMGDLIFSGIQTGMNEGIVNDGLDIPTLPALQTRPELDHNGLFQEIAAKIITGQEPVDAFDAYVADWKSRGGDQWIAEATEWYNNR